MSRTGTDTAKRTRNGQVGYGLVEILAALALVGVGLGFGAAGVQASLEGARIRAATRRMAVLARWMQSDAVRKGRYVGIVFHRDPDGSYSFSLHEDGDGDGIRTADIRSGRDRRFAGPFRLSLEYPGVRLGILAGESVPRIPPARGCLRNLEDPVKFGSSDIVSFSPRGRSSSGSLYVTDGRQRMMALVVYGPTVRLRVWTFRRGTGRWEM